MPADHHAHSHPSVATWQEKIFPSLTQITVTSSPLTIMEPMVDYFPHLTYQDQMVAVALSIMSMALVEE